MAQLTTEDLKSWPYEYKTTRDVGDVLIGEDAARLAIEASSSGNDTALQSMLSQPQWIKIMLEEPHRIYQEDRPSQGLNDTRYVSATPTLNIQWALTVAARNGQAAVASTLLAFAKQQGIDSYNVVTWSILNQIIRDGHADVLRALASADPKIVNFPLLHGTLPLYEAVRLRKPDLVAVLLEFGADPLHPVQESKKLYGYRSSLMSFAAFTNNPRMTEMLLEHGAPIANTAALHTAARIGTLDTLRFLMQHGADVNEVMPNWDNWTPMHFAASKGQVDAMKLLEQNGARSDLKDKEGKTPAQLLEEYNTTKH